MNKEYMELGDRDEQKEKMKEMSIIARRILGMRTCKTCNDTGYESWDSINNQFLPCPNCVMKAAQQAVLEKQADKDNEEKTKRIIIN